MIKIDSDLMKELGGFPWFENCGKPAPEYSVPTRQLQDWNEARRACADASWIEKTEDAQGQLTEFLSIHCPKDYQGVWNKLVREARDQIDSSIGPIIAGKAEYYEFGQECIDAVKWDVLNGVMEASYRSKAPPIFFGNLLNIYRTGRFPCGMEGDGTILLF